MDGREGWKRILSKGICNRLKKKTVIFLEGGGAVGEAHGICVRAEEADLPGCKHPAQKKQSLRFSLKKIAYWYFKSAGADTWALVHFPEDLCRFLVGLRSVSTFSFTSGI